MSGGNILLGSSFAENFALFCRCLGAADSRCPLAVSKIDYAVQTAYTVVGKAAGKECWRILYNMRGAEIVLACIAATQHRITPTLCVAF